MFETLDKTKLPSGEELEIGLVTAHDAEFGEAVCGLLAHKGPEWQLHIHRALRGATDALETRFYLGLVRGQPVTNVMTVESEGVGILGHVFTRLEDRRKGICK